MKKLLSVMIGLGLMMGTVSLFAKDTPADQKTETKKAKKKGKKKAAPAEEKKTA